jgi:UDP-N-acetylglucosamine diphosphorylase / glucose-1-phosphate thymidylyltransferase / UDP-N-acetylgalactosamine diphosphorylase / glucosamine-1-phosphate N-acetyltransferase / galactosamine-1-phosphate N-acetyltransferase
VKQAIILAAGEGRRLRPFTVNKPKSMISIAGKPLIRYVIESLAANGIRDIILVVGYRREQVLDYIGDGKQFGVGISYIIQNKQLGSAHALAQAYGTTQSEFLVLPGDKLIMPETISLFLLGQTPAMLIKRQNIPYQYGTLIIEKGQLTSIDEKSIHPRSNLVNTGIYAFNKHIFDLIESTLDMPDLINNMLRQGISISTLEIDHGWSDVVYPWDILSLNAAILQEIPSGYNGTIEPGVSLKGPISIGKRTIVRANTYIIGPVIIGNGCEIGPNVCIFPSTSIADNVVISPFTEIRNCIIGDDTNIAAGACIQDSVIDKGCTIGSQFGVWSEEADVKIDSEIYRVKIGAMMGEGCRINNSVVAQPGTIIGNHCQIRSLKLASGVLPDKSLVT